MDQVLGLERFGHRVAAARAVGVQENSNAMKRFQKIKKALKKPEQFTRHRNSTINNRRSHALTHGQDHRESHAKAHARGNVREGGSVATESMPTHTDNLDSGTKGTDAEKIANQEALHNGIDLDAIINESGNELQPANPRLMSEKLEEAYAISAMLRKRPQTAQARIQQRMASVTPQDRQILQRPCTARNRDSAPSPLEYTSHGTRHYEERVAQIKVEQHQVKMRRKRDSLEDRLFRNMTGVSPMPS